MFSQISFLLFFSSMNLVGPSDLRRSNFQGSFLSFFGIFLAATIDPKNCVASPSEVKEIALFA